MENSVKERVKKFIAFKSISTRSFERSCGLSNGYINSIEAMIMPNKLLSISQAYPELNTGWLLTGEGSMLRETQGNNNSNSIVIGNGVSGNSNIIGNIKGGIHRKEHIDEYKAQEESRTKYIPLIPLSAQAGKLTDFVASIKTIDCEKIITPVFDAEYAMSVAGESMAPEYPSGSQILMKKINEKSFIDWGKVYVLDTCNGIVIKKLMPSDKDGHIRCVSINPEFPPFNVPLTEDTIYGIYRVLLCMSVK